MSVFKGLGPAGGRGVCASRAQVAFKDEAGRKGRGWRVGWGGEEEISLLQPGELREAPGVPGWRWDPKEGWGGRWEQLDSGPEALLGQVGI